MTLISFSLCPQHFPPASECIKSYYRNYGENFDHSIPENGSILEFSPRGAPPEALPVVLWNRTDPESSSMGRGRLLRAGKLWVAPRVTQADQGNYTLRDGEGKVMSRSTLTVRGELTGDERMSFKQLTDEFLLDFRILSTVTFIFCISLSILLPVIPFFLHSSFCVHDPTCGSRALLQCHPLHQGVSKPAPLSSYLSCPPHIYPHPTP